jgi:Gpi18-like mannosyltransferase
VFLFLSTIPGIVRQNIWWWHPDALTILSIALTFLFLARDHQRFGKQFFIAAFFCGLAVSIKSVGIFFAPVIAYLLITELIQKKISLRKAILSGFGFIAIMIATVFISNPLLFIETARERIIQVHIDHNYFFTHGWADDDPYGVGWEAWKPVLNGWYAPTAFLIFAVFAQLLNSIKGRTQEISRLFVCWVIPFSLYIIYVIAVKPDHYWMPVMLPLFAGVFPTLRYFWTEFLTTRKSGSGKAVILFAGLIITIGFIISQIWFNLQTSWSVYGNVL